MAAVSRREAWKAALKADWQEYLIMVSAIVLAITAAFSGWKLWALLGLGIATFLVGTIASFEKKRRTAQAQRNYADLEARYLSAAGAVQLLLPAVLSQIANRLSLGTNERISVYVRDAEGFVMLSRYSENPNFRKPGRSVYPGDQGVIGKVWEEGQEADSNRPDFATQTRAYITAVGTDYGLEPAAVKQLTMKCRSVGGLRIPAPNSGFEAIGVLIVESMTPNIVTDAFLNSIRQQNLLRELEAYMVQDRDNLPKMSKAKEAGF